MKPVFYIHFYIYIYIHIHEDTHYSMTAATSLDGDRKYSDRSSSPPQTFHWAEDDRNVYIQYKRNREAQQKNG